MKSTEIMIKDFVRVNNSFVTVCYIEEHEKYTSVGVNYDDGTYNVFTIDELDPIQITEEFLEKNGFRKSFDSYENVSTYRRNDFQFFLVHDKNKNKWWLSIYDSSPVIISIIPLSFVHELQHALKMCGSKTDIVM